MICTLDTSRLLLVVLVVFLLGSSTTASKEYEVVSPDSSISITINTTEQLAYSISFRDKQLVLFSHISMIVDDGTVLGANPVVIKSERRNVEETITPIVSEKSSKIQNTFSELSLKILLSNPYQNRGQYMLALWVY
ncbi:MAG: glycoside hydrolase family 97 N-terminal domain-containing protein [Candidatus Dadabacteria bacterium]|nr:glycoside hydrolase family 97 N-terminal domain-containing protein [Candidatus Dadabacteria bacterium]